MKKKRTVRPTAGYRVKRTATELGVREGKAMFSALVHRAAGGEEITITSHGKPMARLTPLSPATPPLRVDRRWLSSMKVRTEQTPAETLIRQDRDGRG